MHLRSRQYSLISAFFALCALWLWLSVAVTHAQGAGPTLQANPTGGVAGNAIKLGGSGFAPGGYIGTILWDGAPVETIQIPVGGSFIRDFILPVNTAPGDHVITICRGSPCLIGAAAQQASAPMRVTATAPQLPVSVAYVYQADTAAAKTFVDLLSQHGMAVTALPLAEVLKTDFRQFALTIIADDTGRLDVWGNADGQVSQIAKNSKVLGIGEGGYAFFGRLGLAIGHPRGAHGSALDIYAVDPALAIYRTPYNLGLGRNGALQVYRDNVPNVALSVTSLGSNTFSTGYQDVNGTFSILASQGCNQLWGFTGDPGKMTAAGRNLFINSVQQALTMPCSGVTLQTPCQELLTAADIGAAGLITFDDLPEATTIENHYAALYGVRFQNSSTIRAITYGKEPDKAESRPNVATNEVIAPATNAGVPLVITFDEPKTHVGFYMGNGETQQPNGLLTAYDATGKLLCRAVNTVPEPHSEFIGLYDAYGRIASVHLDYSSDLPESIDNLTFAPNPQNWRIQLCRETADRCPAATGAVYRANPTTGGDAFAVDALGYVLGAGLIDVGDQLWGLEPMTKTANATIYRTSGAEVVVSAGAVSAGVQGEPATLRLVVKQQQPLLVQDLTISAEWYVQGDAQRAEWLRANLVKAANYLYSFTDGQFTLGRIVVQQSGDGWSEADFRLHLNNVLQPKATIGGIVTADTPDPLVNFTYSPGPIFMGSAWNRYGVPPDQPVKVNGIPVSPATMVDDWAIALAHELGHYLLFLFDTYTGIDGQASQELADLCTGTAMGDAYQPSNQNFIFNPDHWQSACNATEAYHTLKGRTEWQTIRLWYPWVIQPTAVVTGPVAPPANLTTVTFLAPSTPPGEPATSQIFDMIYQDGELTSGEARVFTFRGDRLFEQGKPPKNATQVQLIDAQVADRLCVYDVNDHAEGGDTPRHQFGCEPIQPGDAQLQMTKNVAWQPLIALTQVSTTSLRLAVTQTLPAGAQVVAKLYREHSTALPQQTLTASAGAYSHVFDFGASGVTPVYAQVWVDETPGGLSTRREVVADRGTGGSGAFGPQHYVGGVLVVSSDGKASFERGQSLEIGPGESIAWQSMPGTPPLPVGTAIIGQSYRLDAFPASLVDTGQIAIEFEQPVILQASDNRSVQAGSPTVYFWNGANWQALSTIVTTPVNASDGVQVASAPSQGVGVYAVLLDLGQNQQFLPLIRR